MGDIGSNRGRSDIYRRLVAAQLQLAGLEAARAEPIGGRGVYAGGILSGGLDEETPFSHISGIPRWALSVHADVRQGDRWGALVDGAEQAARFDGVPHFGVVAYRRERGTGGHYFVTTLDQAASLMLELQKARR